MAKTALNMDRREEATDIVVTALHQAIDDMQGIIRELQKQPGVGIGLSGHAAVASASTASDVIACYQNDAAECIERYGHLVKQ